MQILHDQSLDDELMEEFIQEVSVMTSVRHRNVIMCIGYSIEPLAIITELMDKSLEHYFFDPDPDDSLVFKLR